MAARDTKKLLFRLLRLTAIPWLVRNTIQRRRVTILLYHDIDAARAKEHFAALKSRYNLIPLRDYVTARQEGRVGDLPPRAAVITLDDGHRGNYALLDVVSQLGVPLTVFLCSGVVGTNRHFWFKHDINGRDRQELKRMADSQRMAVLKEFGFDETAECQDRQALSGEEIEQMKPYIDFQAHTVFHPLLPRCSDERAHEEIIRSKADLGPRFGLDIYSISYPNGDYSDRDIEYAREAGYACGITVDAGYNSANTDMFRLKRICIEDDDSLDVMLVKASGVWPCLKQIMRGQLYGYSEPNKVGREA